MLRVGKSPAPEHRYIAFNIAINFSVSVNKATISEILVSIASALLISEPLSPFLAVSLLLCPCFLLLYKMAA